MLIAAIFSPHYSVFGICSDSLVHFVLLSHKITWSLVVRSLIER